jgi:hypothetical protein
VAKLELTDDVTDNQAASNFNAINISNFT